jgi:hypothetical protein
METKLSDSGSIPCNGNRWFNIASQFKLQLLETRYKYKYAAQNFLLNH